MPLTVLGFPCNQFGAQEPGTNDEIHAFATARYSANFPMFAKIDVNGPHACALYQWLKSAQPNADGTQDIPWNFTKFLVGRNGEVLRRYAPKDTPDAIEADIAAL